MFELGRKELLTTFNPAQSGSVCDALKAAGIAYDVSASANGSYAENTNYQYHIYVRRKDYEKAAQVLRTARF